MTATATQHESPLQQRRAGILLHPTSLPSPLSNGDLGPEAYRFVDFLAAGGLSMWQTLPLGPTHGDLSPYQCLSVHAGNPLLISFDGLIEQGWLGPEIHAEMKSRPDDEPQWRQALLVKAHQSFSDKASVAERDALVAFVKEQSYWLDDYALYQALRRDHDHSSWTTWPTAVRDREPKALKEAHERLQPSIAEVSFEQFVFFRQWRALKDYANGKGVLLLGDIPIFVVHDSAEVWARRDYFQLDEQGEMLFVAGVPPDYFSALGQRWGNPLYDWEAMCSDGFRYWLERINTQLQLCDLIRIDHFRGFDAYWSIPAGEPTAVNGRWINAPGDALFQTLQEHFGTLPLVVEDLGVITPEVEALRDKYSLPGTKVLQFAFGGEADNPYLPHNHVNLCVLYTGTHDNDTTLGWFNALEEDTKNHAMDYLGHPTEPMPWPLIRSALASVANLAVLPMQDILMLDGAHRMNTPGTPDGNWRWQFAWEQVAPDLAERLRHFISLYGRDDVVRNQKS